MINQFHFQFKFFIHSNNYKKYLSFYNINYLFYVFNNNKIKGEKHKTKKNSNKKKCWIF